MKLAKNKKDFSAKTFLFYQILVLFKFFENFWRSPLRKQN